jgi:hypothetical protein
MLSARITSKVNNLTLARTESIYKGWQEKFAPEFIEGDEENFALVTAMNKKTVWTWHSTTDQDQLTPGAHWFNDVCYETFGWYVSKTPWTGKGFYVDTSWTGFCLECNDDGFGADIDPECTTCYGEGTITEYLA